MVVRHCPYLERADGALSRGDYLTAVQCGLQAAGAARGHVDLRCQAYLVLALASLQLDAPEQSLAYAVGAHLDACKLKDGQMEERAATLLAMVIAHYPYLSEQSSLTIH